MSKSTIHRQLAPTVGPATTGVLIREEILGDIGKSIAVGTAVYGKAGGFIVNNASYMPTKDDIVSACILPIGSCNIFVGMTAKALGSCGANHFVLPTTLPVEDQSDEGFGCDLAQTYIEADQDPISAGHLAEDIAETYYRPASTAYHYVGMIGTNEVNMAESSEPDSILPAINGRIDSEGGSVDTTNMGENSDSDESDFESKVYSTFALNKEVMMTQPAIPQSDEEGEKTNPPTAAGEQANASKEADGAEAMDVDPKANEAAEAKKASDKAEKTKAKKQTAKGAKPRVHEVGEPSTRMPKDHLRTDKDEWNLLTTPIPKDESPQMMEVRRIALLNQSANLIRAKEELDKLAADDDFQRRPERISVENKRTQRRLGELEADNEDPAIRRVNEIDWTTYPTKENSRGEHCYRTPVDNATAALAILKSKHYSPEDKARYAESLIAQALRQQDRGEVSGKLVTDSKACRTAAGGGGPPDEPDHSSSHRGGTSDPKKAKDDRAISRTDSSHGKDREHDKRNTGFAETAKEHRQKAGRKDPLKEERERDRERAKQDRDQMPPPPPRSHHTQGDRQKPPSRHNRSRSPQRSRAKTPPRSHSKGRDHADNKPANSRHSASRQSDAELRVSQHDARTRLNEIKAAKDTVYFGPPCFADNIRHLTLPSGFSKVNGTYRKYDGSTAPEPWLADYHTAVQINNGTNLQAVRFLPLMLLDGARSWIDGLPEKTIHSWSDMAAVFVQHFRGTFKRPKGINDLKRCRQEPQEATQDFIGRWVALKNACQDIGDAEAMHAFVEGLNPGVPRVMVQSAKTTTLGQMLEVANTYAAADDDSRAKAKTLGMDYFGANSRKARPEKKNTPEGAEVNATFGKGQGNGGKWRNNKEDAEAKLQHLRQNWDKLKNEQCTHHSRFGTPSHTNAQCRLNKQIAQEANPGGAGTKGKSAKRKFNKKKVEEGELSGESDTDEAIQKESETQRKGGSNLPKIQQVINHTFLATPSARKIKQSFREINATAPSVPTYLKWTETQITWDQSDHPDRVPEPGCHALVVAPIVAEFQLKKVLMDGGASINLIYLNTLKRMNISTRQLRPTNVKFHGIVPGRCASSLGEITLEVTFGNKGNYRTEEISFEVVPFDSAYHAIFGRPAFAKFLARPCYLYNKMKLPGPNGVITVEGDFNMAKECELANALCAERVIHREELKELAKETDVDEVPVAKETSLKMPENFSTSAHTKKVTIDPSDPTKQLIVGDGLDDK